jgi:hypothetical protein
MLEEEIYNALYSACHGSNSQIQSHAMTYLHDIASPLSSSAIASSILIPIYFNIISNFSGNYSSNDCRLLAILNLKNYVHNYWQSRNGPQASHRHGSSPARSGGGTSEIISIETKQFLKMNLLKLFHENEMKISLQLSLLIALIVRYDWDIGQWNEIFPELSSIILSSSSPSLSSSSAPVSWNQQTNAIQTLLQIILNLNRKRLIKNKENYLLVSFELLQILFQKFYLLHQEFIQFDLLILRPPPSSYQHQQQGQGQQQQQQQQEHEQEVEQERYSQLCYFNALGNLLCSVTRIITLLFLQSWKVIYHAHSNNNSNRNTSTSSSSSSSGVMMMPLINTFLQSIGEYLYKYDEILSSIPHLILPEHSDSLHFNQINYLKFIFQNVEIGSIGGDIWSSITSWNDGEDPIDAGLPTTGSICYHYGLDSIDLSATILSSNLQRYPKVICEVMIQISLTISRVVMSLAVIPYHLQRACSTINEMEALVSPYLSLFYTLLHHQFPLNQSPLLPSSSTMASAASIATDYSSSPSSSSSSSTGPSRISLNPYSHHCVCEPLALVFTLFLSNMLSSYTIPTDPSDPETLQFHLNTTVKQFFSLPDLPEQNDVIINQQQQLQPSRTKLSALFSLLTTHLLPLTRYYFEFWAIDSEELFLSLTLSAHEGDSLRNASEGLFVSLMTFSSHEILQEILHLISQVDRQEMLSIDLLNCLENTSGARSGAATSGGGSLITERDLLLSQSEFLFWEGIFTCCGLTPYHLTHGQGGGEGEVGEGAVDISSWLLQIIGPLLTSLHQIGMKAECPPPSTDHLHPTPTFYLLQTLIYRLLWLMSCWIHVFDEQTLTQIINLLISFIQPTHLHHHQHHSSTLTSSPFDVLVKLQVVQTLQLIIQSSSFQSHMLLPVMENLFYGSCHLVLKELTDPHAQGLVISLFQEMIQSFEYINSSFLLTLVQEIMPLYFLDDENNDVSATQQQRYGGVGSTSEVGNDLIDSYGQEKESSSILLRSQLLELFCIILDALHNPYLTSTATSSSEGAGGGIREDPSSLAINYYQIHASFLSVIHHSTNSSSSSSQQASHLIKDGLNLWSKLLRNTIFLPNHMESLHQKQQLDEIFQMNFIKIFQNDFFIGIEYEEMKTFFSVLECSILLNGMNFILPGSGSGSTSSNTSRDIVSFIFKNLIGELKPRIICYAMRPIECLLLLQCFVNQIGNTSVESFHYFMNGPHALPPSLLSSSPSPAPEFLYSIGIIQSMLRVCCSVFSSIDSSSGSGEAEVETTHGQMNILYLRISDILQSYQEADVAITSYLSILCRIFLLSPQIFYQSCQDMATELNQQSLVEVTSDFIFKAFFHLILTKFDGVGYHRGGVWHRRICCYALLSIYPTSDHHFLSLLPEILYLVDDLLSESMTREGQRKLAQVKFNYLSLGDDQDDDEEDEEGGAGGGQRKQLPINYLFHELLETDPVLVTSLHEFVQQKLQELTTQVMSPEELSQGILREMDQTVMARILSNDYRMIEDEGYDDANCDP